MYKKIFSCLFIFGILFFGFSKADVQDISFNFCDDKDSSDFLAWKKTFLLTAGKEEEMCLKFSTNSEETRKIVYWFTISYISAWMSVCDADKWTGNAFSKFFINKEARVFDIDKDHPVTIKEKILIPIGMSGSQYGCLAYALAEAEAEWIAWWMFDLIVNKVYPLVFFVWWGESVRNAVLLETLSWGAYTTNKKIKAIVDEENTMKLYFRVKNEGNVEQNVIFTGKAYNILGIEKPFSMSAEKVMPWESRDVEINVGMLPFYKWLFNVKVNMQHAPKFDFDVSGLDPDIQKGWIITEKGQVYFFSWVSLVVVVLIIVFLAKLVLPRKKS